MDAVAQGIAEKVFLSDRAGGSKDARFDRVLAELTGTERRHPIGAWLVEQRQNPDFDWDENACDFASRLLGLPPKQVFSYVKGEGAGYEEAAAKLEKRLLGR